jgi:ParB-like chromosome segregation protein Spo0J
MWHRSRPASPSLAGVLPSSPILVDRQNNVIAGHGRLLAARKLGMPEVPVVAMKHLAEIHRKALILADNKIGENASWDDL